MFVNWRDQSIERGKEGVSDKESLWICKSIDGPIGQWEIYCEENSSLMDGWSGVERSSEIRWILAIKVSLDKPESKARWTETIKRSRGVDVDEDDPIVGEIGLVIKVEETGDGRGVEIWTGRSTRDKGSPKASSPLSLMAPKRKFSTADVKDQCLVLEISWAMATEIK